ncbi:DUF3196 family protein [[Acholeplasma] multilocale]|uniref:DUF3196 family protein n=1 Tax=[Acholeplasma] multilocale TaxID=264638 RepID=UPI00047A07D7|nr:DUF3196 family protein [[Acholeplasma] multilocale]
MNYYEELILEIKELLEQKNYEESLRLINAELTMPYIPADTEIQLLEFKQQIINIQMETVRNSGAKNFSVEQIKEMLNNKNDAVEQTIAINNIANINARLILEDIKNYLLEEDNSFENKTFLILALSEQKLDEVLTINKYEEITINPIDIDVVEYQNKLDKVANLIDSTLGQENPSLAQISNTILFTYFLMKFPKIDLEDDKNLAGAIILLTHEISGLEFNEIELNKWLVFDLNQVKSYMVDIKECGVLQDGYNWVQ